MSALAKELETYERERPNLLKDAGKYVLIQDSRVVSVWSTYEDAIQAGYQQFGLTTPFLVKQIEIVEQVHFSTRFVEPVCHR